VEDAVRNVVEVVAAAGALFAGHRPAEAPPAAPPAPAPVPAAPPPAPPGAGGLPAGAGAAGQTYHDGVTAAAGTDDKLAAQLKEIFAANQAARDKVGATLAEIAAKQRELGSGPADPAALAAFQHFLDQKMTDIQHVLADAQVDAGTQAQVLRDLADEYHSSAPGGSAASGGAGGGGDPPPADTGVGSDPPSASTAPPALTDPLAGLGPLGMPGGMDPLAALSGLSGLGGALGGLGAGPLGGLGSVLGPLGQLGGLAGGAMMERAPDDRPTDAFHDQPPGHPTDAPPATEPAAAHTETAAPAGTSTDPPAPAPAAAAPATAPAPGGGDPSRTVALPDGSTVEAPDAPAARVLRAVLSGTSVTDAYHGAGVDLAPPGSPVLHPVDPSQLRPGDIAQFVARPPVLVMGDGKIWLDGQLQPIGALGTSNDFLGWNRPAAPTATPATPAPASPPGTTPTE